MKQKDNNPILLIIPDIHGRLFWISATRKYPDLPVIFQGDYLDPYTHYEGILPSEALANFKEIIDFKKANMERVTLLLGNHDIHYFDKDFLFTHAGVDLDWLRYRMPKVNVNDVHNICKSLNDKVMTEESLFDFVFNGLMDVSASRWGYARYPSPVWTDETDHQYMRERLPNVYQVFGHTQQESEPVITEQYACLDCRRAFLITNKGNIIEA